MELLDARKRVTVGALALLQHCSLRSRSCRKLPPPFPPRPSLGDSWESIGVQCQHLRV
jgi:hypothetical protein